MIEKVEENNLSEQGKMIRATTDEKYTLNQGTDYQLVDNFYKLLQNINTNGASIIIEDKGIGIDTNGFRIDTARGNITTNKGDITTSGTDSDILTNGGNIDTAGGSITTGGDYSDILTNGGSIDTGGGSITTGSNNSDIYTDGGSIDTGGGSITTGGDDSDIYTNGGNIDTAGGSITTGGDYSDIYTDGGNIDTAGGSITTGGTNSDIITNGGNIETFGGDITSTNGTTSKIIQTSIFTLGGEIKVGDDVLKNIKKIDTKPLLDISPCKSGQFMEISSPLATCPGVFKTIGCPSLPFAHQTPGNITSPYILPTNSEVYTTEGLELSYDTDNGCFSNSSEVSENSVVKVKYDPTKPMQFGEFISVGACDPSTNTADLKFNPNQNLGYSVKCDPNSKELDISFKGGAPKLTFELVGNDASGGFITGTTYPIFTYPIFTQGAEELLPITELSFTGTNLDVKTIKGGNISINGQNKSVDIFCSENSFPLLATENYIEGFQDNNSSEFGLGLAGCPTSLAVTKENDDYFAPDLFGKMSDPQNVLVASNEEFFLTCGELSKDNNLYLENSESIFSLKECLTEPILGDFSGQDIELTSDARLTGVSTTKGRGIEISLDLTNSRPEFPTCIGLSPDKVYRFVDEAGNSVERAACSNDSYRIKISNSGKPNINYVYPGDCSLSAEEFCVFKNSENSQRAANEFFSAIGAPKSKVVCPPCVDKTCTPCTNKACPPCEKLVLLVLTRLAHRANQ